MFSHPLFEGQPLRVAAWAWMLATAAWKDTKQDAGGKIVTVKRGQILTSYRQMSKATGVGIQVLRTLISQLEGQHAINTETTHGRLLITICNYEKYQSRAGGGNTASNTEPTHGQHTKEQINNIPVGEADKSTSSEVVQFEGVTGTVWRVGKALLARHGAKNPSIIGKWIKEAGSAARVLEAIEAAERAQTEDPIPYINKALKGKASTARRGEEDSKSRVERWNKIK